MHSNFLHIENNSFFAVNGIYGVAYKLTLPEKFSLSEDDFDNVGQYWQKAFAPLTDAIIVKQDFYLKSNFDTSEYESENFLQEATKNHFSDREYLRHYSYIFFLKADFDTYFNRKWTNPFAKTERVKFEKFEEAQQQFFAEVGDAVDYLKSRKLSQGNIEIDPFTKGDFVQYENFYFSGLDDGFSTNIFTEGKTVYTGDKRIGVFTVNNESQFPDTLKSCILDNEFSTAKSRFYKNYADNFAFNLDCNHIYTQIFFIDPPQRSIDDLEKNKDDLFKARSWSTRNEVASNQTKEILDDLVKSDERRLIRGANTLTFFSENEREYTNIRNKVTGLFKDIDIVPHFSASADRIKSDFYLSFPVYSANLNDKQTYKIPLDCACTLIQNSTHYKEDKEGIIFNSRVDNTPVVIDDYFEDKKYDNARNAIVIAPTGYGKSTLINHKVRHQHERGDKTVIIDYGGSYKKYSAFYPNDVANIVYEENRPLGFNIFNLAFDGEYKQLNNTQLNRITEYILIHLGQTNIEQIENEVFKKIVTLYYYDDLQAEKDFHGFFDFLSSNQETIFDRIETDSKYLDLDKYILLLKRFSRVGEYSKLYEKTEFSIVEQTNKLITIFELEQASADEIMLNVLLYLIDIVIDENVLKDQTTRGHIILDEVAKMYKFKGVLDKVELLYQTVRKKEGAITQVLQTIHQMPEGGKAKSIIENTQVLYVLYAKDYRAIQSAFNLSDHARYQMESLTSKLEGEPPLYSEVFLLRGGIHKVLRLELPKEVFWAYQTDGKKNAVLMDEYEKTKNMQEAINNILNKNNPL